MHRLKGVIEDLVTLGVIFRDENGRYMAGSRSMLARGGLKDV